MLELGKSQFKQRQLGVFGGLPAGFFKEPEEKPCRLRVIPELAFRDPRAMSASCERGSSFSAARASGARRSYS